MELFELVKACQDSRTIDEQLHEKQTSEDQEENAIRCSLSAEQLLDAIWKDGTEGVETKQDSQKESRDEWHEGFDDDDIEEVRIFQTQAVRKRTCSEDTGQEFLEEILILDATNEEIEPEDVQIFRRTSSETDVSDSKKSGGKGEELQLKQNQIKLNFIQESREEREVEEASDEEDDQLETTTLKTGCLEENDKHDDDEDDGDGDGGGNLKASHDCHSVHGKIDLTEDDDDGHDDADENNGSAYDHDETNQESAPKKKVDLTEDDDDDQNNVQNLDKNTSEKSVKPGKLNLTEDDDDAHDEDDHDDENNEPANETVNGGEIDLTDGDEQDNGRKTSRVTDQNVSPSGCNQYRNIDAEGDEHENYKSIDEETEEEYGAVDIAILNQSISLLSDDNDDCQSPEKVSVSIAP